MSGIEDIRKRIARFQMAVQKLLLSGHPIDFTLLRDAGAADLEAIARIETAGKSRDVAELAKKFDLLRIPTDEERPLIAAILERCETRLSNSGLPTSSEPVENDTEATLAEVALFDLLRPATKHDASRGLKSVSAVRPLPRDGTPCKLKRHFKGCLREIVGYADHLASKNAERFIWADEAFYAKARHYRSHAYSERHVLRALEIAERFGILTCTEQEGRKGFVVADHAANSKQEHGRCSLRLRDFGQRRVQSQKRRTRNTGIPAPDWSAEIAAEQAALLARVGAHQAIDPGKTAASSNPQGAGAIQQESSIPSLWQRFERGQLTRVEYDALLTRAETTVALSPLLPGATPERLTELAGIARAWRQHLHPHR